MPEIRKKIIEVKEYKSIEKTLDILFDMEKESLKDHNFISYVKETFANNIYQDKIDFIKYVHDFIYNNLNYTDDQYDETLISPKVQIFIMKGDCDDFAVFGKTILSMFGISSKYILLGSQKNNFTHIALHIPSFNIFFDATNKNFNEFNSKRYLYYKIIG